MAFGALPRDNGGIVISSIYDLATNTFPALLGVGIGTDSFGNKYGSAAFARAISTLQTQASAAFTGNGNGTDMTVGPYDEMSVDFNVTVITGTSPTLTFFVDRKGSDNIYYQIWASTQITTVTGTTSISIGPGCTKPESLGATARVRWVIAGTSPSYTFSYSAQAK